MELGYLCYVKGRRAPKRIHETLESAKIEADRLSVLNPGHSVYVLTSVYEITTEKVNIVPVVPYKEEVKPKVAYKKKRKVVDIK